MERKTCPNCGAQIPSLAGYCPECGAELRERTYENPRRTEPVRDLEEDDFIPLEAEEDFDDPLAGAEPEEEVPVRAARSSGAQRRNLREEDEDLYRDRSGSGKLVPVFVILCGILLALIGVVASQFLKRSTRTVVNDPSPASPSQQELVQTTAETIDSTVAPVGTTVALETETMEETLESSMEESTEETSPAETTAEETTTEEETTTTEAPTQTTTADPLADAVPMYTTTYLNMRSSASTDSSVLTVIPELGEIHVIGRSGNWYEVEYNGQIGYVSSKYVADSRSEARSIQESREEESRKESKEAESRRQESIEESKKAESKKETTKASEETKKNRDATDDSYILRKSSKKYLTNDDIAGLSKSDLRLARNEIYARHGYIFSDSSLQEYFENKTWYTGTTRGSDFDESVLNKYEDANLKLIYDAEKSR